MDNLIGNHTDNFAGDHTGAQDNQQDNQQDNHADLIEYLNPAQREAVLYFDSPLLVIAGAGSGKTRVITNKIAYLIREKNYKPYNILGVTFTNKAAAEMKSRIQELTGIDGKYFRISTFHSLGLRILRESGAVNGFDANWQIIDDNDQKKIIERIIKENFNHFTSDMRDAVRRKISFAKMDLNYPNNKQFLLQKGFNEDEVKIFSKYFQFQVESRVWDYEDLVSLPVKLLRTNEDIRAKYANQFKYVVVDEFQDTNPNQYELLTLLAGDNQNITIVGDDDQAVYSWRGASIRFLFNFENDFPNTHIIKLEQNYRSTPQVLDFANDLISKNTVRRAKAMWTEEDTGNPVYIFRTKSKDDEAASVGHFINRLKHEAPDMFPVALLYRINSQSLAFETEFTKRNISFKILKGLRFFDRKEIKDSLALLKLAINIDDDISFMRVVDFLPLGIGAKSLETLGKFANREGISLFRALRGHAPDKFNARDIFRIILRLHKEKDDTPVSGILNSLLKASGYIGLLQDKGENDRLLNIEEFKAFIVKWETENPGEEFGHLMDRISLDADSAGDNKKIDDTPVFFLTMHNAKGLEFPTVVVVGVNASYMPFFMRKEKADIEEERRLFYVASTRAIKQLVISTGSEQPSRFLNDVNRSLYATAYSVEDLLPGQFEEGTEHERLKTLMGKAKENTADKFLEHPIFGRGKIINAIDKHKYTVEFPNRGEKTIDTSIVPVTFL